MRRLKEVIISLTNRCNSECIICDIPKEKTEELSTSDCIRIIEDARLLGASTVVFSGGEPLLRKDLFELISFARNKHLKTCITSNGLLLDDKAGLDLFTSGINVVNISLEGPKEVHDILRGKGSFKKALSALDSLKKYNIESTIATMVSSYNYKHLKYVVEIAKEKGATTIKFQPFNILFLRDKSRKPEFLISKKQALELRQIVREIDSLCNKYGISTDPSAYLEQIPDYLSGNFPNHSQVCGALWESCPIDTKGNIYPCWVLGQEKNLIGNIKERAFVELWDSDKHNAVRESIKHKGCPGCMMSCYDYIFGGSSVKRRIAFNIGKLKRQGLFKYIRDTFKKWLKRLRFYSSYRGSLKAFKRRLKGVIRRRMPLSSQLNLKIKTNKREVETALEEIALAEKMLKKAINK